MGLFGVDDDDDKEDLQSDLPIIQHLIERHGDDPRHHRGVEWWEMEELEDAHRNAHTNYPENRSHDHDREEWGW